MNESSMDDMYVDDADALTLVIPYELPLSATYDYHLRIRSLETFWSCGRCKLTGILLVSLQE